jgi:F-type H+-transporting ATPase subunit b
MSLLSVSTQSTVFFEGAVNVDLDPSLVIQIGLFVVLLVALKPLLFDPMLKLFEEREKRIEGTKHEASKEDERSAKALAKYEAIVGKGRDAGAAERDVLRAQGTKKEADIMASVRAQTATTVEKGRAAITAEAKSARRDLDVEAASLGRFIASHVLGREVSS